jgi:hypothetical protein
VNRGYPDFFNLKIHVLQNLFFRRLVTAKYLAFGLPALFTTQIIVFGRNFKINDLLVENNNVPYIFLDPLCTFARLHTYSLTNASQLQARVQKRGAGNTFS